MASGPLKLGLAQLLFIVAAVLEVAGDAAIRTGMRQSRPLWIVAGFLVLGSYGVAVNRIPLDFSQLLGVYVGIFALTSVVAGRLVFAERVATTTWIGLAVILLGSAIIQAGARR